MKTMTPYFTLNGNTEEAFQFYLGVFGGEFTAVMRWKDLPNSEGIPENMREKIMHIGLVTANGLALGGTDAFPGLGKPWVPGNNVAVTITADTSAEADTLFAGLSDGGTAEMPMETAFWGDYYGTLYDKFGIHWMVIVPATR